MPTGGCPTRDELSAFVFGRLTEGMASTVVAHLDACPSCEAIIEEMERGSDAPVAQLRRPDPRLEHFDESQCQQAVARIEAICLDGPSSIAPTGLLIGPPQQGPGLGVVRDYRLLEKLGEGGMGTLFKARHARLKRMVAIKLLRECHTQDARLVARFEREMEAIGKLHHPNIVHATDAGEQEGRHYLVMEEKHRF